MKTRYAQRFATLAFGAILIVGTFCAQAAFPERPITIIVSDQAGGPGDLVARALAKIVGTTLNQSVLVDNKPGVYGSLGLSAAAKAKPDGYTLGVVFMPHTVSQTLYKGTPYDLRADFTPLGKVADLFNVLVVNKDVPAKTPQELAELARAKAGDMNFGSGSTGSPAHLAGELFQRQAGAQIQHIPFRGPVDAMTNLVGGRVDFMFLSLPVALPMIEGGRVVPLAVTGARRSSLLPQVPTMIESGFKDFIVLGWTGLLAPAGLPPEIAEVLSSAIKQAATSDEFRDSISQMGVEADYATPSELGELINSEIERWDTFIDEIGLSIE